MVLTTVLPFLFLLIVACNIQVLLDISYFRNPCLETGIEFEACVMLEVKPTRCLVAYKTGE